MYRMVIAGVCMYISVLIICIDAFWKDSCIDLSMITDPGTTSPPLGCGNTHHSLPTTHHPSFYHHRPSPIAQQALHFRYHPFVATYRLTQFWDQANGTEI